MEKQYRFTIVIKGPHGQSEYHVPLPLPRRSLWFLVLIVKLVVLMVVTAHTVIDCADLLASLVQ